MSSLRSILVVGATGKQGGALISALLANSQRQFDILALTRSKASPGAQRLAQYSNVTLIEGDLDHIDAVFKQIKKPLWGLFAVPILDKGVEKEQKQGQELIVAAVKANVSHMVFTSTDRGGQIKSENEPTVVPHFSSKYNIEQLIKEKAAPSNGTLTYTFIRPVAFLDNFASTFFGRTFMTMWRMDGDDVKIQMVSTKDVGKVAAHAFWYADAPRYKNNAVSVAGDAISVRDFKTIFKEETGQEYTQSSWVIGAAVRYLIKDVRLMFWWIKNVGFGVDIPALKKEYPFLMDTRTWLRQESEWKKA